MRKDKYTKEELDKYNAEMIAYNAQIACGRWKTMPYNEFLSIVTQRPDKKLSKDKIRCPFCNSKKIYSYGTSSTLVGYIDGINPNHHCNSCCCQNCGQKFTVEYTGHAKRVFGKKVPVQGWNVWYTNLLMCSSIGRKVLKGIPTCFEHYIYTCSKCGGDVHNHVPDIRIIGDGYNNLPVLFKCEKCGIEVNSYNEYYLEENPHKPRKPSLPWHGIIHEEIGQCFYNGEAVKLIDLVIKNEIELEMKNE